MSISLLLCPWRFVASSNAFFIASIVSVALRRGVVFVDLSAPPAPKANDIATALTLSGISAMITKSYSPKLKYASFSLPPRFSIAGLTA
jgi:hypothetical protein